METHSPLRTPLADIKELEYRIEELIHVCARLREENRLLRSQQRALRTERAKLAKKNDLASSQVEMMLMRLKAMEQEE